MPKDGNFDIVEDDAGNEMRLRPRVNHGAFYDYGSWVTPELTSPPWTNVDELLVDVLGVPEANAPGMDPFAFRKDSTGTVHLRGVICLELNPTAAGYLVQSNGNVTVCDIPDQFKPKGTQVVVSVGSVINFAGGGVDRMIPATLQPSGDDANQYVAGKLNANFGAGYGADNWTTLVGTGGTFEYTAEAPWYLAINCYGQYPTKTEDDLEGVIPE